MHLYTWFLVCRPVLWCCETCRDWNGGSVVLSGGSWEKSLPRCLIEVSLFPKLHAPAQFYHALLARYFIIERRKLAKTVFKMRSLKPKDIILSTSYNPIAKEERVKMIWIHVYLFFLKIRRAVLVHEWLTVERMAQQAYRTTAVPVHLYIQSLHCETIQTCWAQSKTFLSC